MTELKPCPFCGGEAVRTATRDVAGVREQRDAFERRCEELLARATKAERDLAEAEQRETSALGCGFEVLQKLLNERALRASAQDRAFEAEYWSHDRARKAEAERDDLARKLAEALHGPTPGMRAPPVLAVAIEPEAWRVD